VIHDSEIIDLIMTWLPRGGTVLDVGCGGGGLLTTLAERGIGGLGIDPYTINATRCRRLRAEEMDQLQEQFDLVYTTYALHHFPAPAQFPTAARAVLRPAGVLVIVDWIKGAQTGVPERYFPARTIAQWVRAAGFDLLQNEIRRQSAVIVGRAV